MSDEAFVNTVLGPVRAEELGTVLVGEALLSVVPGAQYAYDIPMDRAEILGELKRRLIAFREAGGGAIVDTTGMFHGRDLPMYEALAQATGVHLIATTGMGPEEDLGGYFLTPQTNPPTPWPAEKFAALFAAEISEGMVMPRVERRAPAGAVVTSGTRAGLTPTDISLVQGAARAARDTGAPFVLRFGPDALEALDLALAEGVDPDRVLVAGADRADAPGAARAVIERGAYAGIDRAGGAAATVDGAALRAADGGEDGLAGALDDAARAALVAELVAAGHADRVIVAGGTVGSGVGIPATETGYAEVLTDFVPRLREAGVADADIRQILVANPRDLLTVR